MRLPLPPSAFRHRTEEMGVMDEACSRHQHEQTVLVLRGNAGAGKSALAAQWAHMNRDRFPGGVLYADLAQHRERDGVSAHAIGVFLRFLRRYWPFIPAGLARRVVLFRRRTAVAPVLVVLDNAEEAAQVRSVIPSAAGSVVIATSRHALAGLVIDGAAFLDIKPLAAP